MEWGNGKEKKILMRTWNQKKLLQEPVQVVFMSFGYNTLFYTTIDVKTTFYIFFSPASNVLQESDFMCEGRMKQLRI